MRKLTLIIICCCIIIGVTSCNGKAPSEPEGVFSSSEVASSSETQPDITPDQPPESESVETLPMTESEPVTQLN